MEKLDDVVKRMHAIFRYHSSIHNTKQTSFAEHYISNSIGTIQNRAYIRGKDAENLDEHLRIVERYITLLEKFPEFKEKELEENLEGNGYYKTSPYGNSLYHIKDIVERFSEERGLKTEDLDNIYMKEIIGDFEPKKPERKIVVKDIRYDLRGYIKEHMPYHMTFRIVCNRDEFVQYTKKIMHLKEEIPDIRIDSYSSEDDMKIITEIRYKHWLSYKDKYCHIDVEVKNR